MGEIADAMLNGDMCEQCGAWIGNGDGYPRNCGCDPTQGGRVPQLAPNKAERRRYNEEILKGAGLSPAKITNQGACWCFRGGAHQADFYPGTGRWTDIGSGKVHSGGAKEFVAWMKAGKVYCGGDHCSGLWNLPCDDPEHPGAGRNKPKFTP